MKLLKAKVRWMEHWANHPQFELLVDKMPEHGLKGPLRYRVKDLGHGCALYLAEHDGYVSFFYHNPRDESGYGGATFSIITVDGEERHIHGPWSSNSMCINQAFGVAVSECSIIDKLADYERGYTFFGGSVTVEILKQAAKMAGCHLLKVHSTPELPQTMTRDLSAEQARALRAQHATVYYVPSLCELKPTKWSLPWGKQSPRTEKPIFRDDEKLIIECLV